MYTITDLSHGMSRGINNNGDVVGALRSGNKAFLWNEDLGIVDLNTCLENNTAGTSRPR